MRVIDINVDIPWNAEKLERAKSIFIKTNNISNVENRKLLKLNFNQIIDPSIVNIGGFSFRFILLLDHDPYGEFSIIISSEHPRRMSIKSKYAHIRRERDYSYWLLVYCYLFVKKYYPEKLYI